MQVVDQVIAEFGGAAGEVIAAHHRQGSLCRSTGQWIAAECAPMTASGEAAQRPAPGDGTNWNAARHAFTERQNVRFDSRMFKTKPASGSAKTCLDLIQNQQRAMFGTERPKLLLIGPIRRVDTPFTLDRFNHNCGHPVGDGSARLFGIVDCDMGDCGLPGCKRFTILRIPG